MIQEKLWPATKLEFCNGEKKSLQESQNKNLATKKHKDCCPGRKPLKQNKKKKTELSFHGNE